MQMASSCVEVVEAKDEVMLMARFLDARGEPLHRTTIRRVSCLVYRLDPRSKLERRPASRFDRTELTVDDVFFASLQRDSLWVVDDVGYNFRHRIPLADCGKEIRIPGDWYEVEYFIMQTTGETAVVCFRLRGI
jgi:hypothetical protein